MRASRTHRLARLGRMGRMDRPVEGGCFPNRGPGEILPLQWLARRSGRMGRIGRMFLAYACARAIPGSGGDHLRQCRGEVFLHVCEKVSPYPPHPPFLDSKSLKRFGFHWRMVSHRSSLFSENILPILPLLFVPHRDIGQAVAATTKSSERAVQ